MLLGRSGSGKTTALKMLNGLMFPTAGEVLVEDRATTDWDLIELRRSIGYVIQEVGLFPHFTIGENVGLVPRLKGWPPERIAARVAELLHQVGLEPAQFLRSLSAPAFGRTAAARGRGAGAGRRTEASAFRRTVRRARPGYARSNCRTNSWSCATAFRKPPSSSRTTCAKRCAWHRNRAAASWQTGSAGNAGRSS